MNSAADQTCYEQKHRTSSRPWLTRTATPDEPWRSTTHASYTPPRNDLLKREGRRKQLLKRFLLQQMAEELAREMETPNPVAEYDTEYDGSFGLPGFVPSIENIPKESETHKKYPLYSDAPISFWQSNRNCIDGLTRSVDPVTPFKRNSAFTKPWEEILDDPDPIKPL
ncbi:sperm-associated antigen 8-like isoform X2 [Periplaneta americana]|uniref:sperm-associated antigen 8-like isoform X2 n=1 Tax=Periplaneta americana TaxID=6978 RepID=UPI0037E7E11F